MYLLRYARADGIVYVLAIVYLAGMIVIKQLVG